MIDKIHQEQDVFLLAWQMGRIQVRLLGFRFSFLLSSLLPLRPLAPRSNREREREKRRFGSKVCTSTNVSVYITYTCVAFISFVKRFRPTLLSPLFGESVVPCVMHFIQSFRSQFLACFKLNRPTSSFLLLFTGQK